MGSVPLLMSRMDATQEELVGKMRDSTSKGYQENYNSPPGTY
jgi:hypothetical protein